MKKKVLAYLLSAVMLFMLAVPALADTPQVTTETTYDPNGQTVTVKTTVSFSGSENPDAATDSSAQDLVILYTNDVHCHVKDNIGYSDLARLKNALKASGKNVLLVDSGDSMQGDVIGTLSKGEYIIDIMNAVGYDISAIGNHEFDYGIDQLKKNIEKAQFPFVCLNLTDQSGNPLFEGYRILESGGRKIAFIGITTPETLSSSSPAHFKDENGNYLYSFMEDSTGEKLYEAVQKAADDARAEGADYVIALSHLGIEAEASPWTSSEVIGKTSGIDVFLDAHSHSVLPGELVDNKDGEAVLLTSTGTQLKYVGCLVISADGTIESTLLNSGAVAYADLIGALSNDGGVSAKVAEIDAEFSQLMNQVIARSNYDLIINDPANPDIRVIRSQETNLGDLCADAYRAESGADIAFLGGGGIRATIPAGDITYTDMITVLPFGNNLSVIEASGQQVLDALEYGAYNLPGEFAGFMQVSGLTYYVDLNVDSTVVRNDRGQFAEVSGERRVKGVQVLNKESGAYEPIDPEKKYSVVSNDFWILNSGDGFTMFEGCKVLTAGGTIDNQVLISYLTGELGGTVPETYRELFGSGRITIIDKGEALPDELLKESEPSAPALVGGWTVYEDETEAPLPEDVKEAFDAATEKLLGVNYVPVAYLGSQVVAGMNYAVLCRRTVVAPGAKPKLAVVIINKPLDGECTVLRVSDFDVANVKDAQAPAGVQLSGGWTVPEEYSVINLPADAASAFAKASENHLGNTLEPIAYLANQTVAGMNYAILCRSTLATNPPVSSIQVVTVFADLEGSASFTDIRTLDVAAYNTDEEEEPQDAPLLGVGENPLGGWTVYEDETEAPLPEDVKEAFTAATEKLLGVNYVPVAYLGSQVVAGINYAVLCRKTIVAPDAKPELAVVIVNKPLEGECSVLRISDFDVANVKEAETPAGAQLSGGWTIPEEYSVINLPADAAAAFTKASESHLGNTLEPIAYLANQTVAGMNYAILCRSTLATNPPVSSIQVVTIFADLEGSASFSDIRTLDIAAYNTDEEEAPQDAPLLGAGENPLGGWTVYENEAEAPLPEDVKEAFAAATEKLLGVNYVPVAYLGSQVVAGTNYAVLCRKTVVAPDAQSELAVLIVNKSLDGECSVLRVSDFDVANVKEPETPADVQLAGGWTIPEEYSVIDLPANVDTAFEKATESILGNTLEPIAYLAEQTVSGMNYAILCRSTLTTNPPVSSIQVVTVFTDLEGCASIADIRTLDIAAYNVEEPVEDVIP